MSFVFHVFFNVVSMCFYMWLLWFDLSSMYIWICFCYVFSIFDVFLCGAYVFCVHLRGSHVICYMQLHGVLYVAMWFPCDFVCVCMLVNVLRFVFYVFCNVWFLHASLLFSMCAYAFLMCVSMYVYVASMCFSSMYAFPSHYKWCFAIITAVVLWYSSQCSLMAAQSRT